MRRLTALAVLAARARRRAARRRRQQQGVSVRVDKDPFRITVVRDGETVVARGQGRAAPLPARVDGERAPADEGDLVRAGHDAPARGTMTVATDEPGRTATVTVVAGRARRPRRTCACTRRRTSGGLRLVRRAAGRAFPRRRRAARARSTCAGRSCRSRSRPTAATRRCRSSRAPRAGACRSATLRIAGARVPRLARRDGCRFGVEPAVHVPGARGPHRGLRAPARGSTSGSTSGRSPRRSRPTQARSAALPRRRCSS